MHKKTTLRGLKVLLLKTILPVLFLTVSFYVTSAQNVVTPPKKDGKRVQPSAVTGYQPGMTKEQVKAQRSQLPAATPTDVPALNRQYAEKMAANPNQGLGILPTTPTSNIINDVCTFNGGLVAGDATLNNGRFFRDGVPSTCAAVKACPGPFGTGPYFYDTYTLQNLTCSPQCVTVNYIANAGGGDVFVVAYNGSFNPANLCTNYMADGGSSSLSGGAGVTFNFNVPANTTVVFVAMAAQISTPCPSYTMTVTGLNCTPPPACIPIGPSVLSQVLGPPVPSQVFNQTFTTAIPLPAGWASQNLSNPVGATGWFQGNNGVFPGNTPPGYIAANFNNTTGNNIISNWLFAPNVTLKNNDTFSFFTRTTTGTFPDRLQVRMSTNGASVNAGTTNTSVGDFTTLLLDINPTYTATGYPTAWTQFRIPLSGLPAAGVSGRIAFRYFVEGAGPAGANSDYIGIDDVVYTTTLPGPPPTTCTGSTTNLQVDIQGGIPGDTYNLVLNAAPGGNFNVNNYTSGNYIAVTPAVNTVYTLVSVISASNPCCIGTGNSGTVNVTVLPATITPIAITANPSGPLCAGNPTLLSVIGAPGAASFTSAAGLTIPSSGVANPYPLPLTVSGLPAGATVSSVRLNNLNHTWTGDIDVAISGPGGVGTQAVMLLSDLGAGGNFDAVNTTLTFSDAAAGPVPAQNPIPSGTYRPTNSGAVNDVMPAPGPNLNVANPVLTALNGPTMNGTWNLWINDQVAGDVGTLASYTINFVWPPAPSPVGWTFLWAPAAGLSSTTTNPVAASPSSTRQYTVIGTAPGGCQTSAAITITVYQLPAVTSQPSNVTACAGTSVNFTVGGTGQGITYQWQVSTNGGVSYTNLANGAPYAGVTTATLTVNPVTVAMSGWRYRCVISGTCPPAANSVGAILTVNALPVVTISPVSPVCGGVAGINGTALTASGANSYVWTPNGAGSGLYTNATATTVYTGTNLATVYAAPATNTVYTVTGTNTGTGCINTATVGVVYTPAVPSVNPTNVAMCLGDNAVQLCITSSLAPSPFTTTYASGPINIPIISNVPAGGNHTINVPIPSTAQITAARVNVNMSHTWVGDVAMVLRNPAGQIINLDFFLNATGGTGATTGFTNTTITSDNTAPALNTGANPYTGTFRADRVVTGTPAAGPTGFLPTTNSWPTMFAGNPQGNWTLAAYDAFTGDDGNITSWSITFDYLYGPPASGVWTPATGLFRDAAATIPYVAGDTANCVYARPTPSGVYPYQVTVTSVGFDAFQTFTNPAPITIPSVGTGTPYPSNIAVTGLPTAGATVESVVLAGLSHTWSNDIDVLLQSPTGQNVILMSDVGGTGGLANVTYTFRDNGAAMGTGAPNATGTYRPTNFADGSGGDNWPAPGPGAFTQANPALALFGNTANVNGTWRLMVVDDVAGDQGQIANGWSIQFKYPTPGCVSNPRTVTVTVNNPTTVVTQPVNRVVCTDKVTTYTVVAGGSGPFNYRWEVSTNGGNPPWNLVSNGGVYSGATTATLTITAPPVSMSGYFYRCIITGAAPCAPVTSFIASLTVNPLPTVVISAAPYTRLFPGLRTTLSSTVSPAAAAQYTWLRNGVAVAGALTGTLNVDVDGQGVYTLRVTDVNGCTNTSNAISILDSASGRCFIYPNPTSGQFQVRYYSAANNVLPRSVTVYNANGDRVFTQFFTIGRPYDRMDVDLRRNGKGLYWVEVGDLNGNRLTMCRVVVQ
jgi:subtilisin-like proprotein convertase family protein